MQVRVLGPLEVADGDDPVVLGGRKERAVLAVLALNAGEVVSKVRLIEALWDDDPPRTAAKTIDTYVLRLRKALARGLPPQRGVLRIETKSPGYILLAGPEGVDIACVERLVASAREAAGRGDHSAAAALLRDAAGFWHGRPLEEFADQRFAEGAVARLEELQISVLEERLECDLALGRHNDCVAELEALVAVYPFRERLWGQLMCALYRSNRQADALRAYQRARTTLVEEMGIEPGPSLRQLEAAVIAQDQSLDVVRVVPADLGGGPFVDGSFHQGPSISPLGNLPLQATSFIGRDGETDAIVTALGDARVLTLTGPGGVGKTRLALEVAAASQLRYPDGAWFCALAPLVDGTAVGRAVATVLSVQQRPDLSIVDSLVESLQGRTLLLVLDNGEHLLDAIADFVEAIVRGAPHVRVLVTSRAPVGVAGEQLWPIQPLAVPDSEHGLPVARLAEYPAVALFVDRARVADPRFVLTDGNAEAVNEICRRLDGIPLAVELAAARIRFMSPAEMAARLDRPLRLLSATTRTARGRTLRATVDWSYGLLEESEQRVFNRLSVFAGGFSLDAAERVCQEPVVNEPDVIEIVASLADKSMVIADQSGKTTRYRLLEALREYGQERLEQEGEAASLRCRHAQYFVGLVEHAESEVRGPDEARWVDRLDEEFHNLRAVHTWAVQVGDADTALHLVAALHDYAMWGMRYEVATWADIAAGMPAAGSHPRLPVVLAIAGHGAWARGDFDRAIALGEQALATEEALGTPPSWLPRVLLAHLAVYEHRLEDAEHHLESGIALARARSQPYELAHQLWLKASFLAISGDSAGPVRLAEEALRVARRAGSPTAIAMSLHELGREVRADHPQLAMTLFEESVRLASSVGNRLGVGMANRELTALRATHDDAREALRSYPGHIDHWSRAGDWWNQWINLRKLAVLLVELGRSEGAAVLQAAASSAHPSRPITTAHAERLAVLEADLGHDRFLCAIARGAALGPDEIVAFARQEVQEALASLALEGCTAASERSPR